jgi:hypothetical protein
VLSLDAGAAPLNAVKQRGLLVRVVT